MDDEWRGSSSSGGRGRHHDREGGGGGRRDSRDSNFRHPDEYRGSRGGRGNERDRGNWQRQDYRDRDRDRWGSESGGGGSGSSSSNWREPNRASSSSSSGAKRGRDEYERNRRPSSRRSEQNEEEPSTDVLMTEIKLRPPASPTPSSSSSSYQSRAKMRKSESPDEGSILEGAGVESMSVSSEEERGKRRDKKNKKGEERKGAKKGQVFDVRDRYDNVRSRKAEQSSKEGVSGSPIPLTANFFPLITKSSWCLYNYRVSFSPEEERAPVKKKLLRVHAATIGANIFDGSNMYTIHHLSPDPLILYSTRETDGVKFQLTISLTSRIPPGDVQYLQFYSIIIRTCLQHLKFEELGRNFYDRSASIRISQHKLELWPGYITTLRNYEERLMLCVEVTHKVLRQDTALHVLHSVDFDEERSGERLVGGIVMTHYNRRTYRIDDIDWTKTPASTFDMKGVKTTIGEYYYNKYQLRIRESGQPLLVSRPKKNDEHRGERGPILLVPEFCQMTGLAEESRKNYKVMKDLAAYLQQAPERRVENIGNFMKRMLKSPEVRELLVKWGLEFEGKLVNFMGRVAPADNVIFREHHDNNPIPVQTGQNADWTQAFKNHAMYSSAPLRRWVLVATQRDFRDVENLLRCMKTVGRGLNFNVSHPLQTIGVHDNKTPSFLGAINQAISNHKNLDLIFFLIPATKTPIELYSAIKRKCYIDHAISSQCFQSKHLAPNTKGLMSIITKTMIQINAKLGGEPWATTNPLKSSHTMIVGFDVYHCGKRKGKSVGAMVATTNKELSRYYSTVCFHEGRDELSERLCASITKCIHAFKNKNGDNLPDRIILYRDGVGEGHLSFVFNTELVQIKTALEYIYTTAGRPLPKFSLIIVTKRGNCRIFHRGNHGMKNPDAGTIADSVITLPERYDFYLIAQASKQGTVTPTAYNVIYDEQGLDPDRMQRLTFKLCHLYYNWSGTVAVPAVCQYAHKLAYLTGVALNSAGNEDLAHLLYFL